MAQPYVQAGWKRSLHRSSMRWSGSAKFDEVLANRPQTHYEDGLAAKTDAPPSEDAVRATDLSPAAPVLPLVEKSRFREHPTETADRFESVLQHLRYVLTEELT